jgi:hypothetical protein
VENDGEEASLSEGEISGFEAVIKTDGSRPVLFVVDGFVDLKQPSATDYAVRLSHQKRGIQTICAAVGRVEDPSPSARPLGNRAPCS